MGKTKKNKRLKEEIKATRIEVEKKLEALMSSNFELESITAYNEVTTKHFYLKKKLERAETYGQTRCYMEELNIKIND